MAQDRLTREDVLKVAERMLSDHGWTLHLTPYRTHTGDPFAHPWTGPIAWECRARATFQKSAELLPLITALQEMGLDFQIVSGDEDGATVRIALADGERILTP